MALKKKQKTWFLFFLLAPRRLRSRLVASRRYATPIAQLALVLALLGLAACEKIVHTDYELAPPPTASGRACVSKCEAPKEACLSQCASKKNRCDAMAKLDASSDYDSYATQKLLNNRTPTQTEGEFYRLYDYPCNSDSCEAACTKSFNSCYGSCGGKVTPHSYCTAFCN
jgi:hypothetical protein